MECFAVLLFTSDASSVRIAGMDEGIRFLCFQTSVSLLAVGSKIKHNTLVEGVRAVLNQDHKVDSVTLLLAVRRVVSTSFGRA